MEKRKSIYVRVPVEIHQWLVERARENERTVNSEVVQILKLSRGRGDLQPLVIQVPPAIQPPYIISDFPPAPPVMIEDATTDRQVLEEVE